MGLHVAQPRLALRQTEIREVRESWSLKHEQTRVRVVDNAPIGGIEDEGLVKSGILLGSPQRARHRLHRVQVEWPLAIGVHLERAAVLPAVHGQQARAQVGTVDGLLAGSEWPAVRRRAGKREKDDPDPDRDRGEPGCPSAQAPAKGDRNQPPAQPEQHAGRRNEQHRVRCQAENGVGLRRAGHAGIRPSGPKRGDQPGDQQQPERPQPSQPPRRAAAVFVRDRHWAREMTVWRRGGSM